LRSVFVTDKVKRGGAVLARYSYSIRLAIAIFLVSFMSSCLEEEGGLDKFPPMANDNPPGASAEATTTATALGRGVNFDRMFEWTTVGEDFAIADQLIAKAREGGFTSLRLPVRWSSHAEATAPYTIDSTFFAQVETVVDHALAASLYVVVDMHHHRQLDGDPVDSGELAVEERVVDVRFLTM